MQKKSVVVLLQVKNADTLLYSTIFNKCKMHKCAVHLMCSVWCAIGEPKRASGINKWQTSKHRCKNVQNVWKNQHINKWRWENNDNNTTSSSGNNNYHLHNLKCTKIFLLSPTKPSTSLSRIARHNSDTITAVA